MILKFNEINITAYIGELSIDSSLNDIYKTVNFTLPFKIIKEKEGVTVDYDKTVEQLYTYVTEKWNKKANIKLT